MKQIFLYGLIILCISSNIYAQNNKRDTTEIKIIWKLISNNYNKEGRALTQFTIINKGNKPLKNNGWSIYFCYNRDVFPFGNNERATIKHINGDIFQLKPKSTFKELNKDETEIIFFLADGEVLNKSSAPLGLYLVWDDEPKKGLLINDYEAIPIVDHSISYLTDEDIYKRNAVLTNIPLSKLPKIFPTPLVYEEKNGNFMLAQNVQIQSDPFFDAEVCFLKNELKKRSALSVSKKENANNKIVFIKAEMGKEAYLLDVSNNQITITASTTSGAFYAIQSLLSALPVTAFAYKKQPISIPELIVKDEPRFEYRSLSLDIARNFRSKKELFKVLDLLALYKMNVLHLHFSDDEGWRIEMPSLPELTEVGALRGHTINSEEFLPASFASGPKTGIKPGSGFYTKQDFIEILKYATARHIEVIPEIESPGHSRAAIKAMDARYRRLMNLGKEQEAKQYLLRDTLDQSIYTSAQLWTDNVMCVAQPSTYTFISKVVDDLSEMYKIAGAELKTIHMGGDEVPAGVWEKSPISLQMVKDLKLNSTDDLWFHYYSTVNNILKSKNLFMSGWEEMAMRKTKINGEHKMIVNPEFFDKNIQVHVWNNMIGWGSEDLPYRLANAGYKVVLSPVSNNYFDMSYFKHPEEPGYYWGGYQDIDKPFQFIPFDYYKSTLENAAGNPINRNYFIGKDKLTDYGKANIVGIEGLLWSETLQTDQNLEYMLLPKLLGLAERAWAKNPDWAIEVDAVKSTEMYLTDFNTFINVVSKRILPKLDYYNGGYTYRIPTAGAISTANGTSLNVQYPSLSIRYTTDGTLPSKNSKLYNGELINNENTIKVQVFNALGRGGRLITVNKK